MEGLTRGGAAPRVSRRAAGVAVGAILAASLLAGAAGAQAAPGDLSYQGCITGDTAAGPTGSNACAQTSSATLTGTNSGLDALFGLTVSPIGNSAYAASHSDDAIAEFSRNPSTGALTYQGCISGRTETVACTRIPTAKSNGLASGLDEPYGIAISPNGAQVYLVAQEDDKHRNLQSGCLHRSTQLPGMHHRGDRHGADHRRRQRRLPGRIPQSPSERNKLGHRQDPEPGDRPKWAVRVRDLRPGTTHFLFSLETPGREP